MKRSISLSLFGCALMFAGSSLFAGGCAADKSGTAPSFTQRLAASYLSARTYDRANQALNMGNDSSLERLGQDLRLADSKLPANQQLSDRFVSLLIEKANLAQAVASNAKSNNRVSLQETASTRYRAALAFVPQEAKSLAQNKALDAEQLNSLGYFLANYGETPADFERAELLTRLAVQRYDELYAGKRKTDLLKAQMLYTRATGPQDSHAWALFKQGRLDEARDEAEEVLTVVTNSPIRQSPPAEISYHLAEIYRVSGEVNKALPLYREALTLDGDEETRSKVEIMLKLLSGEWRQVENLPTNNIAEG